LDHEISKCDDGIFCMHFNDGINFERHCAFPIVSRVWYKALGYFTPEIFGPYYATTWIEDIARLINRLYYIPDVLVEHPNYAQQNWELDTSLFQKTYSEREEAADKLKYIINSRKKEKV